MITVVNIQDKGVWDVTLRPGLYDINGSQLQVTNQSKIVTIPQNSVIKKIDKRTQIVGYQNRQKETISVTEFSLKRDELLAQSISEDDEDPIFDDLEAEYACKRFLKEWVPVYDTVIIEIVEPLDIRNQVTDTGNQFITGEYFFGINPEQAQYVYNRELALRQIVSDAFSALDIEFDDKVRSYLDTNNEKVWGVSKGTKSTFGLSSVVAFNSYLFTASDMPSVKVRGSLDEMKASYDTDVGNITAIVKIAHAKHFRVVVPVSVLPDSSLNKLYADVEDLFRNLAKVESKAKTDYEYRTALLKAQDLKKILKAVLVNNL